jgi:putative peptidoglycan lipid II flippase
VRGEAGSRGSARDDIVDRHKGLVGRTFLVSLLTLASRLLGFVREVVSAAIFGDQSAVYDAFVTAWRVPNLFRRLFGEGALSTSLQTAVTEADGDRGADAGRRLFLAVMRLTLAILVVVAGVSMVVVAGLPDRMPGTGWAWMGADPGPVRDLTVRLMPFVVVVCLAALAGGALNVRGHYRAPNLAPVAMNLGWIAALLALGVGYGWGETATGAKAEVVALQWEMARWLSAAVVLSGVLQLAVQVPALFENGLLRRRKGDPEPAPEPGGPGAWDVLRSSAPLALGAAVYQINVMIDGLMAEGLVADGGPAAHYYANRVQQFPLALIAVAATNAVFPSLKALGHRGRLGEVRALHDRTQLGIAFLALPAACGLAVLAQPIAAVLFQHGAYGAEGVARMAATIRMLALALLPAGAVGLLGRAYYAMGDFRTPVRVSIAMLVVNVGLNAALVAGLGMDVDGLALATALSSWLQLLVLLPGLRTRLGLPAGAGGGVSRLARFAAATAVSGLGAWAAHRGVAWTLGLGPDAAPRSVVALAASALVGVASYLALASLLRVPEWSEFRARLDRRTSRNR